MLRVIVMLSLLILSEVSASATTWYVDSLNGVDTNDGLSILSAFASMTKADSVVQPGDTVSVLPGKGYGTIEFHGGGTAGNPVTWNSYFANPMTIIHATGGTGEFAAVCFGAPYITLNGFDIAGHQGRSTLAQAWANASQTNENGQNLAIFNEWGVSVCADGFPSFNGTAATAVHGSAASTITFSTLPAGTVAGDVVIDTTTPTKIPAGTTVLSIASNTITLSANNTATIGDLIAIYHKRGHIIVSNNKIHDWPGNGVQLNSGDYFTITGNMVYNNGFWSPSGNSGISMRPVDEDPTTGTKILITGNIAFGNRNFVGCDCFSNQSAPTTASAHNASTPSTVTVASLGPNPPSSPFNQWVIYDATNSTRIPPGTTATNVVGNVITLSNPNTIVNGDTILIEAITDGEGIILDDLQYTQGEGLPVYGGRQLVQSNLTFGNGSAGFLILTTSHTDAIGNTHYLNMQTPGEQFYGDPRDEGCVDCNWFNNAIETCSGCQLFFDHATSTTNYGNNLNHGGGGFQGQTTLPGTNNVDNTAAGWTAPSITPPAAALTGGPPFAQYFLGFQLPPGSPAIDKGSASVQPRTLDILGNPGLTGPSYDIGAFESPCSSYGGNTIQSINTALNTLLATGQAAGSITPQVMRQVVNTAWCDRPPYLH